MDFYKELENTLREVPTRERQETGRITSKPEHKKLPYKNTCHKTIGEYFPTIDDKIKLLHYLKDHPSLPIFDQRYVKDTLK